MQEEKSSSKGFQNFDVNLKTEEPAFRIVKSCPKCHSIVVTYQKWKRAYICNNCGQYFKDPVFKQIKDRRKELPIPPALRKRAYDREADKSKVRVRNKDYDIRDIKKDHQN
jgi:DNA-directed RNA polymerase subunit M/transcription elongation factor TFIIS